MRANDAVKFLRRMPLANTAMVARHLECREDTAAAILMQLKDEGKVRATMLRGITGFWMAVSRPDRKIIKDFS